ncbi:NACHT domain-containing protein [Chitinophaga sp. RAB17]|uniref:NACHT domain-containing protein n=1 Tax=Chitinophaga sp. RAB17 TaxID=3233049 RepID=UPI003F8DBACA
MNTIIQQYHYAYNTLSELFDKEANSSGYNFHSTKTSVENLLDHNHLFIVAEPGYGKTTLIKQIKDYLDLHRIPNIRYEGSDSKEIAVNTPVQYLIYDALDENKTPIPTFIELLNYGKNHELKLIISNRIHYISQIEHLISEIDFTYIRLLSFNDWQIANLMTNRLSRLGFTEEHIDNIIRKTKAGTPHSILKTPRYLDEFCKYIIYNSKKPEEISYLKKSELFEKVIYYKLESENKLSEINKNYPYIAKRVLERLSLAMEIHQTNEVSKDEFVTFLDQSNSNINQILLTSISLDNLWERVMKTTGASLKFEHTEFQEYLAAKELLRLGHRFQIVADLMIEDQIDIIIPNWIDVLNFAIDMEPLFIDPLLSFIKANKWQNINEKLIEIILSVDHSKIDISTSEKIFSTCFSYYSLSGKYIPHGNTISEFYQSGNCEILTPLYSGSKISPPVFHIVCNQVNIISSLNIKGKLSTANRRKWISYLSELLENSLSSPLYDTLLYALVDFEDKGPILKLMSYFEEQPDHILNLYLIPMSNLASENQESIELLIRSLKSGRRLDNIAHAIKNVRGEQNLLALYTFLVEHPKSVSNPNQYLPGNSYCNLYQYVADLDSADLDNAIHNYFTAYFEQLDFEHEKREIIAGALSYLIKKNTEFVDTLIKLDEFIDNAENYLDEIFSACSLMDFQKIESKIIENRSWNTREFIQKSKEEVRKNINPEVYSYMVDKYPIDPIISSPKKNDAAINLQTLRGYYVLDKKLYNTGLIPYLVDKFQHLNALLEEKDKTYLKQVIKTALKHYDPDKFKISIEQTSASHRNINYTNGLGLQIGEYFQAAFLLDDISTLKQNRLKLLKSFPILGFRSDADIKMANIVFEQIGPITINDQNKMFESFMGRKDDLLVFNPTSFAEMIRKLNLGFLSPLLAKLLRNAKISTIEKITLLEVIGDFAQNRNDYDRLKRIFNRNLTTEATKELADVANSFLISKFKDEAAVKWRFQELKSRLKEFDPQIRFNGLRPVSVFENELDHMRFGKCLLGLNHSVVQKLMLDLLAYSFDIRTNRLHLKYSEYLQSIIFQYYKSVLDIKCLKELRDVIARYRPSENAYSFNPLLEKLSVELNKMQKGDNTFLDAIHILNKTIGNSYLPITSNFELKETITRIINMDIVHLIENEGFYRVSQQLGGQIHKNNLYINEELVQKTLKIALEKALLAHGFRKTDIYREVESLDSLRYDYLIKYGLFGPIVVEIKLLYNNEIQNSSHRSAYKSKLSKYLSANNGLGIYLIFQTKQSQSHLNQYNNLLREYSDISGLDILLIKCY